MFDIRLDRCHAFQLGGDSGRAGAMDGIHRIFIGECPIVRADGGMVIAEAADGKPCCRIMSPHLALVLAGALRDAANAVLDAGARPTKMRRAKH